MTVSLLLVIAILVLVLAWNLAPSIREKMRGFSTILEAIIGGSMYYFGIFSEAIKEGQEAGYIPDSIVEYVPLVLLAWIIIKRIQTKTPVGSK